MNMKKLSFKIVICMFLAAVICIAIIVTIQSRHNNRAQESTTSQPVVTTVTEATSATVTTKPVEEKVFPVIYKAFDGYEKVSLEEMTARFEKYSSKFSYSIRKRLTRVYQALLENIESYQYYMTLCGYPDAISFIHEKYVKPLASLGFIKHIHEDDPNYNDLRGKYQSSCFVPEENGVYLIDESFIDDDEMDLIIAEEIVHAGQNALKETEGFGDYLMLDEGEANVITAMQKPFIDTENITFFYDHHDPNHICEIHGISHQQNVIATRYYTYLTLLAGYKNVVKWRKTDNSEYLTRAISERFKIDGTEFYDKMYESMISRVYEYYDDDASIMFEVEKRFLKCFNTIIQNVKTKTEAQTLFETYRYLRIQYGLDYTDYTKDEENGVDITDQFLDRSETEDSLYEMVRRFKIKYIRNQELANKQVFFTCIHPQIPKSREAIPASLNRKDLIYDGDTNSLRIVIDGKDDIVVPVEEPKRTSTFQDIKVADRL